MAAPTAPWVRTRLRTAPGAAAALGVLVLLAAFLAAAFPRAVAGYEDDGLRRTVAELPPHRAVLAVTTAEPGIGRPDSERAQLLREDVVRDAFRTVHGLLPAPFEVDAHASSYGVRSTNALAADETWLPRPDRRPARFQLYAQGALAGHATEVTGRLPRKVAAASEVEAAVTGPVAERMRLKPGSVLHLPAGGEKRITVRITGVVTPDDPAGGYWGIDTLLRTPELKHEDPRDPESPRYWLAGLILPPDAAPVLLQTDGKPEQYLQYLPDGSDLTASDLPRLRGMLANMTAGQGLLKAREATNAPYTFIASGLGDALTSYERLRSGISPVVSVAAYGTATVACIVLLMAGGLGADRRRGEFALLRSRGASLKGIAGRLGAESAVVAVPAAALGCFLAVRTTDHGTLPPAVLGAAAVAVLACAALPVRALFAHRTVRMQAERDDVATARPSARRTVAELTVLVLAIGAIVALRRRGTGEGDSLVALAPVLVGVVAAFLLVRLYPLPLRRLTGPMSRLRGAVGYLSLARAGRAQAGAGTAVLPLLALLTALTTAAFGGSVLAGIDAARNRAALLATGADARVALSQPLPDGTAARVKAVPGVRDVAPVALRTDLRTGTGRQVSVAAVDRAAYARLSRHTGLGAFPVDALAPVAGGKGPVPALASSSLARRFPDGRLTLQVNGQELPVRIAAVRPTTPALADDERDFLVMDAAGFGRASGTTTDPSTLLLTGDAIDGDALRKAAGSGVVVQTLAAERARYVDSPLQSGATDVYVSAVAAGAGFAVLALMLSLARATPERLALLARLRTLGLTRRQGRRLLILEALPQALLAAAGGTLTGWAAIRLLAPGLDLSTLALADARSAAVSRLTTDPLSLAVPAVCVLGVAVGVAALQAWWAGRRGSVKELRAGESA
ncbi:FtsX-like permease family protein [Streptomyces xanthii]|uniref:ABC transporter permease n=1 Tax=Streptomyces xanthii TaxID=2768069 RepID=A0A7H1BBU6_9ACTN|nr:FtsX-like permease family protein [Streptomyces xanthii]QNS06201.1 ABC transporter permease [Streptomyces xanthii]